MELNQVVQALFNKAACSDLTLIVNDQTFYGHRDVLIPVSGYLQSFVKWPLPEDGDREPAAVVRIQLPDLKELEHFPISKSRGISQCFEYFLKVAYGLCKLSEERLDQIFIVAQIAEYMISPKMTTICDDLLSTLSYTNDQAISTASFCQNHELPKTFQAVKIAIANNLTILRCNPRLYQLDPDTFSHIVKLSSDCGIWPVWITSCFAAGVVPKDDSFSIILRVKDHKMVLLFQDVVQNISKRWSRTVLNNIFKGLTARTIIFEPPESDQVFLYRAFAERFHNLDQNGF